VQEVHSSECSGDDRIHGMTRSSKPNLCLSPNVWEHITLAQFDKH
jgi:hypothetical protein